MNRADIIPEVNARVELLSSMSAKLTNRLLFVTIDNRAMLISALFCPYLMIS